MSPWNQRKTCNAACTLMPSVWEGHFRILEIWKPLGINWCNSLSLHFTAIAKCTQLTGKHFVFSATEPALSFFLSFRLYFDETKFNYVCFCLLPRPLRLFEEILQIMLPMHPCALKIYKCYAMSGNTFMKIIHLWVDCERFQDKRV